MVICICSCSIVLTSQSQLHLRLSGIRFLWGTHNLEPSHGWYTVGFVLTWESGTTPDLMGGGAQAARWALGNGCKYRWSFARSCCVAWFLTGHGLVLVCGPGFGDPVGTADIRKTCGVTHKHFSSTESSNADCHSAGTFHKTRLRLRDKLRSTQIRSKDFLHFVTLEPFYEDRRYISSVETWPFPWIRIIVLAVRSCIYHFFFFFFLLLLLLFSPKNALCLSHWLIKTFPHIVFFFKF